jgi:hypothetical protein
MSYFTRTSVLSRQPSHEATHCRQIGRDRFGIARTQRLSELLKGRWISMDICHLFLLTFA